MSSYNIYIGGKAEFNDGSKWNLLYLPNQDYSNGFPLKFEHSVGNGAFILSEGQAKKWSDDFAAWFAMTACWGLYVGEPEKGGPKILTKLAALAEVDMGACRRACEAASENGRFMCALKAVFDCDMLSYDRGLGKTASYRHDRISALVEFRVAVEKDSPLEDPRRVLFDEWPSNLAVGV